MEGSEESMYGRLPKIKIQKLKIELQWLSPWAHVPLQRVCSSLHKWQSLFSHSSNPTRPCDLLGPIERHRCKVEPVPSPAWRGLGWFRSSSRNFPLWCALARAFLLYAGRSCGRKPRHPTDCQSHPEEGLSPACSELSPRGHVRATHTLPWWRELGRRCTVGVILNNKNQIAHPGQKRLPRALSRKFKLNLQSMAPDYLWKG